MHFFQILPMTPKFLDSKVNSTMKIKNLWHILAHTLSMLPNQFSSIISERKQMIFQDFFQQDKRRGPFCNFCKRLDEISGCY